MLIARWMLPIAIAGLSLAVHPKLAMAHAVETNYAMDLLTTELEFTSTFSTGEPMQNAEVLVYAPGNPTEPWITGKTDDAGRFAFMPDTKQVGEWTVHIQKEGHADILKVPVTGEGVRFDQISFGPKLDLHYQHSTIAGYGWKSIALMGTPVILLLLRQGSRFSKK